MSIRCLLGHKYEPIGHGDLVSVVDGRVRGGFVINRCAVCGKVKQVRLS